MNTQGKRTIKSWSDIISFINYCEDNFGTENWVLQGINVWPLVRFELGSYLAYKVLGKDFKRSKFGLLKRLIKGNLSRLFYVLKNPRPKNKHYPVAFFGDGTAYCKIDHAWYEKNCDPFIEYFNSNNIDTLKIDLNHTYKFPKYHKSFHIQSVLDVVSIRNFILLKIKRQRPENIEWYSSFCKFCQDNEVFFSLGSSAQLIKKFRLLMLTSGFFENFLKKYDIKLAFVVSYYGFFELAYINACKNLKIPVIDIQHGVQGDNHPAYGSWVNVPPEGYSLLPDKFWCWSALEFSAINTWASHLNTHKPINGGNLFLEKWFDGNSVFVKKYDDFLKTKLSSSQLNILYTANLYSVELSNYSVLDLIRKTQSEYNWLIRLHPQEAHLIGPFKKHLNDHGISRFEIEWATEVPLYALLRKVDLHITLFSSVVIEADKFNIPSVILSPIGVEMFSNEIDKSAAFYIPSMDEIIAFTLTVKKNDNRDYERTNNAARLTELLELVVPTK